MIAYTLAEIRHLLNKISQQGGFQRHQGQEAVASWVRYPAAR
jgi:hypothetical protein